MAERPTPLKGRGGRFLGSLGYACRGVKIMMASEANARIHAVATILVVGAVWYWGISRGEWLAVLLAVGLVWLGEGMNSAIEAVVDLVSPGEHPLAGRAKDLAAGAVLCAAVVAGAIGVVVFGGRVGGLLGWW